MRQLMTKAELIAFEADIAKLFEHGEIKAPVHLSSGNEDNLIRIFHDIDNDDWVFSTHRNHYHALLKGIDREWLRSEILAGHSISINSARHKFFTSAIVGGALPIALGVAYALKLKNATNRVWVFVGDMAAETGAFCEACKFAAGHNLPISFIIEDNGLSVCSITRDSWGVSRMLPDVSRYYYQSVYPHQGVGKWVTF